MTATETAEQEYQRLTWECSGLRRLPNPTPAETATLKAATNRLLEILAIPPTGYTVPATAAQLAAHAQTHGWQALGQWTPPGYAGEPFYSVQVGRVLRPGEMPDARANCWKYKFTWHSRGCAPGRLRLFGSGSASTPDQPAWRDAPSVKAVRAVITNHPA